MKGRVLLRLVLAAVIVASMVEVIGTVPPLESTAIPAGHSCVSDADCKGTQICCPISGTCTTPRGCRKDPLN
ncbi:MAG: hypothetical protein ACREAA_19930 [Candidatus Polarisedimenticolia bacterium]